MERQKVIGWILFAGSGLYLFYLLKTRILVAGPVLEKREWMTITTTVVGIVLGLINLLMAAAREQRQKIKR